MTTCLKLFYTSLIILISTTACGGNKTQNGGTITSPEAIIFASDRDATIKYYWMAVDDNNTYDLNLGVLPKDAVVEGLQWIPGWTKFIFSASTGSDSEIYTIEQRGRNLVNLTNTQTTFETSPVVSADGDYIAFVAVEWDLDIFLMKSDGSARINLTNHPARDTAPAWLSDGRIVFSSNRQGTPNIYSMKKDGTDLTNISKGPGLDSIFSVSPDGNRIVFDSDRAGNMDLFIVDANGENLVNLTGSPANETEPLWSPDGQRIAFLSDKDNGSDIFVINVDGSSMVNLTKTPDNDETGFSWAPDGLHLVFSAKYQGQGEIFVVGIDGTAPVNLTKSPTNEFGPVWIKFR